MRAADQRVIRWGSSVVREVVRVTECRADLVTRQDANAVTLWSGQPAQTYPLINSIGMVYPLPKSETCRALLYADPPALTRHLGQELGETNADTERLIQQIALDRAAGFSWRKLECGQESVVVVPVWGNDLQIAAALGVADVRLAHRVAALNAVRVITAGSADVTSRLTASTRLG